MFRMPISGEYSDSRYNSQEAQYCGTTEDNDQGKYGNKCYNSGKHKVCGCTSDMGVPWTLCQQQIDGDKTKLEISRQEDCTESSAKKIRLRELKKHTLSRHI